MRLVWARLAAGLSVACALAHAAMAWSALVAGNLALLGAALGMAVLCLPCALRLWRGPDAVTWRMTTAMTAVMLVSHRSLMTLAGHAHHDQRWTAMNAMSLTLLLVAATGALLDRSRSGEHPAWRLIPAPHAFDHEGTAGPVGAEPPTGPLRNRRRNRTGSPFSE